MNFVNLEMMSLRACTYSILSIFLFATVVGGCGAKKSTSNLTSRNNTTSSTNYRLGECSRINGGSVNLDGQIGTYYDPYTGAYRSDFINVNLTSVPATLFTSDNVKIQFFRWSEKVAGQKVVNQIPTRFFFVDKLTGQTTQGNTYDQLTKSVLTNVKNYYGASWVTVTLLQFFQRTMFVLTGVDMTYDAVEMRISDASNSSSPISKIDVLLPAFVADPNIYKQYNPIPNLYALHPNYSLINSGASEADYVAEIEEICRALAGINSRVPASIQNEPQPVSFWQTVVNKLKSLLAAIGF